jgi:hypothetical protein
VHELLRTPGLAHKSGEYFIEQVRQESEYAVDKVVKLSHLFVDPRPGGREEKVLLTGHTLGIVSHWTAQRRDGGGRTALLLGMKGVGKSVTTRVLVAKTERGTLILWADTGDFLLLWPSRNSTDPVDHALTLTRGEFLDLVSRYNEELHQRKDSPMPRDVLLVYDSCCWPEGDAGKNAWIACSTWVSTSPRIGNFESYLRRAEPLQYVQPVLDKDQLLAVVRGCFAGKLQLAAQRVETLGVCTTRDAIKDSKPETTKTHAIQLCQAYKNACARFDGNAGPALHHFYLAYHVSALFAHLTAAPRKLRAEAPAAASFKSRSVAEAAAAPRDARTALDPQLWGDLDYTELVWLPNETNLWLLTVVYHELLQQKVDDLLAGPSNQLDAVKQGVLHEWRALKQVGALYLCLLLERAHTAARALTHTLMHARAVRARAHKQSTRAYARTSARTRTHAHTLA